MKVPILLSLLFNVILNTVQSQNIGVGTINPSEKLHVAGNIKADTIKPQALKITPGAGLGKILTSDALGNANWGDNGAGSSVGYGVWGDCTTNSIISGYQPVTDSLGAVGDAFGVAVSISGNYAITSAYNDNVNFAGQGSATIFKLNGNVWEPMQKITDPSGAANDFFGISAAIYGNFAVVGAYGDNESLNDQGSVVVYQFNGSSWVFFQKLTDPSPGVSDNFGFSVSMNGNFIIVGAYGDDGPAGANQGSACVFQYNGSSWVFQQKLVDPAGALNDEFGYSVSITTNYAVVGAHSNDNSFVDQGSATVYQFNGTNWVFVQTIFDPAPGMQDQFGNSVSITPNYLAIGSPSDDIPSSTDQGSALIYKFNGSSYVFMQKVIEPLGASGDYFGASVSLSGNYLMVGAIYDAVGGNISQGSAVIFVRNGAAWQRMVYMTDPAGGVGDNMGISGAIDADKRFIVGCHTFNNGMGKIIFGKVN